MLSDLKFYIKSFNRQNQCIQIYIEIHIYVKLIIYTLFNTNNFIVIIGKIY